MHFDSSIPGFSIRFANRDDCHLILDFVRQLAEYEKLAHKVFATEARLSEELFTEPAAAEVLLAYHESEPVGFALFFQNFSTFLGQRGIYLEDLFVKPQMRGRGYGKALLAVLAQIAVDRGCGRLEWAVLDWNQPAIDFYESIGSQLMKDWIVNRLDGPALKELAAGAKVTSKPT